MRPQAEFNLTIEHIAGPKNHADALSRLTTITASPQLSSYASRTTIADEHYDTLRNEYAKDPYFIPIYSQFMQHTDIPKEYRTLIQHYTIDNGLLYYQNSYNAKYRLVLPLASIRTLIVQLHHDSNPAGHQGPYKTFQHLMQNYYWPNMIITIRNYTRTCENCQNSKHVTLLPPCSFTPLAIPKQPWPSVSIDFVTGMNKVSRLDCILVVT